MGLGLLSTELFRSLGKSSNAPSNRIPLDETGGRFGDYLAEAKATRKPRQTEEPEPAPVPTDEYREEDDESGVESTESTDSATEPASESAPTPDSTVVVAAPVTPSIDPLVTVSPETPPTITASLGGASSTQTDLQPTVESRTNASQVDLSAAKNAALETSAESDGLIEPHADPASAIGGEKAVAVVDASGAKSPTAADQLALKSVLPATSLSYAEQSQSNAETAIKTDLTGLLDNTADQNENSSSPTAPKLNKRPVATDTPSPQTDASKPSSATDNAATKPTLAPSLLAPESVHDQKVKASIEARREGHSTANGAPNSNGAANLSNSPAGITATTAPVNGVAGRSVLPPIDLSQRGSFGTPPAEGLSRVGDLSLSLNEAANALPVDTLRANKAPAMTASMPSGVELRFDPRAAGISTGSTIAGTTMDTPAANLPEVGSTVGRTLANGLTGPAGPAENARVLNASMLGTGRFQMTMQLDPPALGQMRLHLQMQQQVLSLRVEVENRSVAKMVESGMRGLQETLAGQGIRVDRTEVVVRNSASEDSNLNQQNNGRGQESSFSGHERSAGQMPDHGRGDWSWGRGSDDWNAEVPEGPWSDEWVNAPPVEGLPSAWNGLESRVDVMA